MYTLKPRCLRSPKRPRTVTVASNSAFAFACNTYNDATVASGCSIEYVAPGKLGDTLTADEAERMGLVAYRCGDDELRDKALELGAKLAAKPPQALQYTKQLTRHGADAIREQIKKESVLFAERMFSDETRAIFDKFLNKK